jgi:hypothetical protein
MSSAAGRVRRVLIVAGFAASLLAGVAIVLTSQPPRAPSGPVPAPPEAQPVVVTEVLSGDRLVVRVDAPGSQWQTWGSLTVRLAGAEVGSDAAACHAQVAAEHLKALTPVGSVVWAVHEPQRDADGAWPVWLWSPRSRLLAAVLTESGDLRPVVDELSSPYVGLVTQAADTAVQREAGRWGDCS